MAQVGNQPTSTESFVEWVRDVDRMMSADYGITIIDAGIDDARLHQHWAEKQSPKEFVTWFAEKYDLTPTSELGWYAPRAMV